MNICYPNSLLAAQLLEKYGPEVRDRVMSHIESDQFKEKFGQLKAEASTFTYKGNTIETPFKLSTDQEQALTKLVDFINDPTSVSMTLEGAAGTGKTTIIGLLKKLTNSKFVFSAPTHAATAELAKAVVRFGETRLPTTVRSSLAPKKDENGKQVYENGVPQYVFAKKVQDRFGYSPVKVLVVDEVSMIGDSDFANLHTAAKNSGVKIIFLGDRAQLPEPKSPTISKAFTEIPSTNLTTVHRQKDQQLAEFLTQVRAMNSFVPLKLENSATTTFTPDRLTFEQQFVEQVKKDPEGTVWIADTNKAVKEANTHIRDLFGREGEVQKGDVLVGYLGYESKQVEKGNLANAISYTVEDVKPDPNYPGRTLLRLSSKRLNDLEDSGIDIPTIVQSTYLQLSSSDSLQGVGITSELMAKNNEFVSSYFEAIVNAKDKKQWKALDIAKTEVAMTFAKIDLGDTYIYNPKTKKMELYSPSSPEHSAIVKTYGKDLVIEKGVDFGHAITIYKAQGATIPHVFVDMGSFRSVADQEIKDTKGNPITTVKQSLYYVALSRAQDSLTVYQGNFGFLPYTSQPVQPKVNPNEPTLEWVEQNILNLPEVQSNIVEVHQGRRGPKDDREFNYYTRNLREAIQYGNIVETISLDISNYLHKMELKDGKPKHTEDYLRLKKEFEDLGNKTFDILDSSEEGLKNQERFFRFLRDKGYSGYSELVPNFKQDENEYVVSFKIPKESTQIKPGVQELFDSNPELANAVYEALGFRQKQYASKLKEISERRKLATKWDLENSQLIKDIRVDKTQSKDLKPNAADNNLAAIMLYGMKMSELEDKGLPEEMLEATTLAYRILNDFMFDINEISFYQDILLENPEYAKSLTTNENPIKEFFENDIFEQVEKEDLQITPQQKQQAQLAYSQYLDTIFPNSKVKDIVYHGSPKTKLEKIEGISFWTNEIGNAYSYNIQRNEDNSEGFVTSAITNIKNPHIHQEDINSRIATTTPKDLIDTAKSKNADGAIWKDVEDIGGRETQIVVFEPDQIHILGSKQDIEGFKKFVSEGKQPQATREYTPENIESLKPGEVFVFGSNTEGRHGKGAALKAKEKFGAITGKPTGKQGQSYAIVTKNLTKGVEFDDRIWNKTGERSVPLDYIEEQFANFFEYANNNPNNKFYVTKLGSSLAGYTTEEIREVIRQVNDINGGDFIGENVILPKEYEVRDKVEEKKPIVKSPAISEFQGEYRWLSNFEGGPVMLDGKKYATVEHAYQAAKTLDLEERFRVQIATSPGKAKHEGKLVTLRKDWDQVKISVMKDLLKQKFSNPELKTKLLATGNAELVEGNKWGDIFWGVSKGKGENNLGKLLMSLREELRGKQTQENASTIIALAQPKTRVNRKDLTPAMIAARKEEVRKTFIEEALANPDKEFQVPWKNPRVGNYPDASGFKPSDYVLFMDELRTEYGDKFPTNLKFPPAFQFEMDNNPDRLIKIFAEKINAFNNSRLPWRIDQSKLAAMNAKMQICLIDENGKVVDSFINKYGEAAQKDMADALNYIFFDKYNKANGIVSAPELLGSILKLAKGEANRNGNPNKEMWADVVSSFAYSDTDPKVSFLDLMFENLAFLGYRIDLESRNKLKHYFNYQKINPNFANSSDSHPLINIEESSNWKEDFQDFIDNQLAEDWLQVDDLRAEVIKGWQDSSFEKNNKDSATARLKLFMAGQFMMEDLGAIMYPYDSKEEGVEDISHLNLTTLSIGGARQLQNKKLKHKDYPTTTALMAALNRHKLLPQKSSLGFSKLMPFDLLWERVQGLLADVPNLRFKEAMAILRAEEDPNLDMLANRLEENKPGMARNRAEFVKIMNMQYNQFLISDVSQGSFGRPGEGKVYNAQRYNQLQTIRKEWRDAQLLAPIIKVRPTGEKVIDIEKARHHMAFIRLMQLFTTSKIDWNTDAGKEELYGVIMNYLDNLAIENPGAREFLKDLNMFTVYGLIDEERNKSSLIKKDQRPIQKKFIRRMFADHGMILSDPVLDDMMGWNLYKGKKSDFISGKIQNSRSSFVTDWLGQYSQTQDETPRPKGMLSSFFFAAAGLSQGSTVDDDITEELENAVKENNPMHTEGSAMDLIASFVARHSPKLYNAVHRTLEGKQNWDYSHPTSLSNAVNEFMIPDVKDGQNSRFTLYEKLKESLWGTNFYLDKLHSSKFGLRYLEGLKVDNSTLGRVRENMSDREQLLTSLTLFANGNRREAGTKVRLMNVMSLSHSDKTVTPVFYNVPAINVFGDEKDGLSKEIIDAYYTLFEGEWKRIKRVQQLKAQGRGTGSASMDAGGEHFFLLPGFNKDNLKQNAIFIYNEDGSIKTDLTDSQEFIREEIGRYLLMLADKTEKYFEQNGISMEMLDKSYIKNFEEVQEFDPNNPGRRIKKKLNPTHILKKAAWDYTLNTNLWNSSAMVLFMGDPANAWKGSFDETFQEISKRLAKDIAPGLQGDFEHENYAQLTLEDVTMEYKYAAALGGNLVDSKVTDAQEYTTTKEHLLVMLKFGKIEQELYDRLIEKYNKGEDFSKEELAAMMEPMGAMKPVYTGARFENGLIHYDYIKTMSFPLLPQLTRNSELDKLRLLMEGKLEGFESNDGEDKYPRVTFKSGSKLGTRKAVKLFDDEGRFITPTTSGLEESVRSLKRSNFRIQQEVPSDDEKTHIDLVTQMDKLITEGILDMKGFIIDDKVNDDGTPVTYSGTEVRAKKEAIRIKSSTKKLEELLDRLQIDNIENPIPPKKVIEMLVETARATEYSPNDVALLESLLEESYTTKNEKGEEVKHTEYYMEYPIFFHSAVERFEKLLLAQVRKITKFKMPGKSYVQASSIGMIRLDQLSEEDKNGIVLTGSWDMSEPLKHMHEKDGKIVGAQVIAPFNFHVDGVKQDVKDYLIPGSNMLDMDRVPKELLQLIGARIPNQGHNSMMAIEIVGFTPDWLGDLMIVPGAVTSQMGSDFDVDKLYTYQRPYTRKYVGDKGYGFEIDKAEDLQLDYFNIHWGVLTHPEMYAKVMSSLDKKDLSKANEKYALKPSGLHTYFSMVNQLQTFQSAKDAKALVGITSLLSVFESNIQNKVLRYGSYVSTKAGPQEVPYSLELDGLTLTHLAGKSRSKAWDWTEAKEKWYSKHDNITIDQTGAVDNAKDRTLDNLNISVAIYPAFAAMNMFADVSKDDVPTSLSKMFQCAFSVQEILWDFTSEYRKGNDSLSEEYNADLKNSIIDKLRQKYRGLITDLNPEEINSEVSKTKVDMAMLDAAHNSHKTGIKDNIYYIRQLAVLDAFESLTKVGERLAQIQKTLNQETNGAGPSLAYVLQQERNFSKFGEKNQGKILLGEDSFLEPSQLTSTFSQVIPTAKHLLNSVFPVKAITNILEDIALQQGKVLSDLSLKTQTEVIRELRAASISTSSSITTNPVSQRMRLLYNSDQPSLATRVQILKGKNLTNTFLKRINTDINVLGKGPDYITFLNQKSARSTDNQIIQDFVNLLQFSNKEEREVAEDIVLYTLLFTPQYSSNSIFSKLPSGVLLGTDIASSLRTAYANLREGIVYPGFMDQLYQHMPSLAFKIDTTTLKTCLPQYEVEDSEYPEIFAFKDGKNEQLRIVDTKPGEEKTYPSFLTFYSKDEKRQILYKLKGLGETITYQRIDISRKVSQYDKHTSGPIRSVIQSERAAYEFNGNTEHYNLVNRVEMGITARSSKDNAFTRWGLPNEGEGSLITALQQMSSDPVVPAYIRTLGEQLALSSIPQEAIDAAKTIGIPWKSLVVKVQQGPTAARFAGNTITLSPSTNIKTSAENLVHETLHSRSLFLLQALGWMNMSKLRKVAKTDKEFETMKATYEFNSSMFAAQHPELYNKAKALDKLRVQALEKLRTELMSDPSVDLEAWEKGLLNSDLGSDPRQRVLYSLMSLEEFVVNAITHKETIEFLNTVESLSENTKPWYQKLVEQFLEFWNEVLKVLGTNYNDKSILKEVVALSYSLNSLQENKKPVQVDGNVIPQQLTFETEQEAQHMANVIHTTQNKETTVTNEGTNFRLDIGADAPLVRSVMIDRALESLDRQLSRLDDIIAGAIHSEEDRARKNRAEILMSEVKADREYLAENGDLLKMTEIGMEQLRWVESLLKRGTLHVSEVNLATEILDTWDTINQSFTEGFESDHEEFNEKLRNVMGIARELVAKVQIAAKQAVIEEGIRGTSIKLTIKDLGVNLNEIHATQASLIPLERDANRLSQMLTTFTQYHVQTAEAMKKDMRQELIRFMSLVTPEQYYKFIQENKDNTVFGLVQELSPEWYYSVSRYSGRLRHRLEELSTMPTGKNPDLLGKKLQLTREAFENYWKDNEVSGVMVPIDKILDHTTGELLTTPEATAALEELYSKTHRTAAEKVVKMAQRQFKKYLELEAIKFAEIEANTVVPLFNYEDLSEEGKAIFDALPIGEQINFYAQDRERRRQEAIQFAKFNWKNQNSPLTFLNTRPEPGVMKDANYYRHRSKFKAWFAPKNVEENLDPKYRAIQADPKLQEAYEIITSLSARLREMLPPSKADKTLDNFLPIVSLTQMQAMNGVMDDFMKTSIGQKMQAGFNQISITEEEKKAREGKKRQLKVKYTNPVPRKSDGTIDLTNVSTDIPRIFEMFGNMIIHYHNMHPVKELSDTVTRIVKEEHKGRLIEGKKGMPNLISLMQYYQDMLIYKMPREFQGISDSPTYSANYFENRRLTKEMDTLKKRSIELVGLINDEYAKTGEFLPEDHPLVQESIEIKKRQEEINSMARYMVGSKVTDALIGIQQLKSMSYNPFSAVANLGFGYMSTMMHARGFRAEEDGYTKGDFTVEQLKLAYKMMKGNIGRSWMKAFGYEGDDLNRKIKAIIDRVGSIEALIDVNYGKTNLVESQSDVQKFFDPYAAQKSGDFLTKGACIIARALNTKVEVMINGEAKTINLFEALGNDGEWNAEKYGENKAWSNREDRSEQTAWNKFTLRTRKIQLLVFGAQDRLIPQKFREDMWLRLLGQFKASWIPEGIKTRFGSYQGYDEVLEREIEGRYRTLWRMPGKGVNVLLRQALSTFTGKNAFEGVQIWRTVDGVRTLVNIGEHEKENMRRNLVELAYIALFLSSYFLLKASLPDDEEMKRRKRLGIDRTQVQKIASNMLYRMYQDLAMYSSPSVFDQITSNPIPAWSVIKDALAVPKAWARFAYDEEYELSKPLLKTTKAVPFLNLINKCNTYMNSDLSALVR